MPTTSISPNEHLKPRAHAPAGGPNLIASFKNDIIGQTTTSFASSTKVVHGDEASAYAGVTTLYHRNQQYSVTALSDSSGNVSERYAYTAYGQPTFLNATGAVQTSSTASNRYTYTGREWDSTLGLYHFRARWMSGLLGRFVSRDPFGYWGGIGLYEYVKSSSHNFIDPSGLSSKSASCYLRDWEIRRVIPPGRINKIKRLYCIYRCRCPGDKEETEHSIDTMAWGNGDIGADLVCRSKMKDLDHQCPCDEEEPRPVTVPDPSRVPSTEPEIIPPPEIFPFPGVVHPRPNPGVQPQPIPRPSVPGPQPVTSPGIWPRALGLPWIWLFPPGPEIGLDGGMNG
jgi:RHS repeat-associated protein